MNEPLDLESRLRSAGDLFAAGKFDEAAEAYRQITIDHPDQADAWHFLGISQRHNGALEDALAAVTRSVELQPDHGGRHHDLGVTLAAMRRFGPAAEHFQRAISLDPSLVESPYLLGVVLRELHRYDEAIEAFGLALERRPGFRKCFSALCDIHKTRGDLDRQLATAEAALRLHPQEGTFHIYRGEALFELGRLEEGWKEYVWRFLILAGDPRMGRFFNIPRWNGESLADRTVAVWTEQGLGDIVLYASMINDLVARSKSCIVQVPHRLAALFRRSFPRTRIMEENDAAFPGDADVEIPIPGLGRWLRPTFETFPRHTGYLKPDPDVVAAFRQKYLADHTDKILVGIAWRSQNAPYEHEKSIALSHWGAILAVPGARFVSVQYGDTADEIAAARKGFGVDVVRDAAVDTMGDLDDFAAQVAAMDVVISTSNTAAHFAGALGVPTLCMLPKTQGLGRRWYWFAGREPCAWYPSVTRLVQAEPNTWSDVIAAVALHLLDRVATRAPQPAQAKFLAGLASSYRKAGLKAELEMTLRAQGKLDPGATAPLIELARLKAADRDLPAARALCDEAVRRKPADSHVWNSCGALLADHGLFDEAAESYRRALALDPRHHRIHNNLGTALRALGRFAEALEHYRTAYRAEPNNGSVLLNLAGLLTETGSCAEGLAVFDNLIRLDPDNIEAQYSYGQALLRCGRFAEGWERFTWRWRRPQANVTPRHFPAPLWAGEDLAGKAVLTYTEQGVGDEVLIASMIPDLIAVAGSVTVLCSERMVPLFRRSFPAALVGHRTEPLPDAVRARSFDVQMSLSELGARFRRGFEDFPARPAFLVADPTRVLSLGDKYRAGHANRILVGVSWRSTNPEIGQLKTGSLPAWLARLRQPGVCLVDLQYGDTRDDRADAADLLHDPEVDALKDMDLFAAQVAAMDLVVTVSNTTAHVAGGLGVSTRVVIPRGRGRIWYWFGDRPDSPWYPSVRLHAAADESAPVVPGADIVETIAALVALRSGSSS
jgi:tetratricopeptide (TPR) repeat protein